MLIEDVSGKIRVEDDDVVEPDGYATEFSNNFVLSLLVTTPVPRCAPWRHDGPLEEKDGNAQSCEGKSISLFGRWCDGTNRQTDEIEEGNIPSGARLVEDLLDTGDGELGGAADLVQHIFVVRDIHAASVQQPQGSPTAT